MYSLELLKINAVFLRPNEPFTWASGIKSPIYCDNRLILSAPQSRRLIERGMADLVQSKFPRCEMLMGTATAGIAHAALVADLLGLPMGYVRSSAKDHGRANRIEGKMPQGAKVVVIEDLISTGGSCIEVVNALREAGAEVLGVVSIFTYGLQKAARAFADANTTYYSLANLDELVEEAAANGYISPDQKKLVLDFRDGLNGK
ncbi:MAG: orotate phosphoribosyltransferase [Bacteroidales bacterium]|nr:orotate phosphoribosyltransferase [Bacteroidales bacterium]